MTDASFILLLSFSCLLCLGTPVAICIALSTLLCVFSLGDIPAAYIVAQRMTLGIASFPLLAIPFFILSGELMGKGGMARRLMDLAALLVGRFRGGLAYVNTVTCMLFGAVSGSSAAAVSSVGGFMIPEMERKGYGKAFSVALTTTSATTGLLIPPSNIMIVYAVVATNVSVAALFLAGIVPGILMGLCIVVAAVAKSGAHNDEASAQVHKPAVLVIFQALPSLFLVILVLGGILGGVFSATEASAVAVAYALVLGLFVHRELRWLDVFPIFSAAAKKTSVVMLLIGASQAVSWALSIQQVPQSVSAGLLGLSNSSWGILLLINVLLLLVGTFMDMTPAVLIFTPILLPVVTALGIDPVHFGVLMVANLCIGLCTPPVGGCLFLGCSVGGISLTQVVRPLLPMFVAMVVALLLITYVPALSLWLPRTLGF